jgi:hypothetical protein
MSKRDGLTKIHVELPNHWATGGESMWALQVGEELYELRNVPFHAYDLNFGDIVRATADGPELKPEIREVVKRSGNRTLRVFFSDILERQARLALLESLAPLAVSYEGATERLYALDLEPEADVTRVRGELDGWAEKGWLAYETCEARVAGGFDDAPHSEEAG